MTWKQLLGRLPRARQEVSALLVLLLLLAPLAACQPLLAPLMPMHSCSLPASCLSSVTLFCNLLGSRRNQGVSG